ncbi:MAG: transglutaminase family protein [Methanocellales archaeon]
MKLKLAFFILAILIGVNCIGLEKSFELSAENLTIPAIPAYEPRNLESKPASTSRIAPGYRISIQAKSPSFYKDSIGVVKLWVENNGDNSIFIYKYGVKPSWLDADWYAVNSGITIQPGERKYLGLVSFKVEAQNSFHLKPGVSLLARAKDGKWYDYGDVFMDPISYTVNLPISKQEYEYKYNFPALFKKINDYITPSDPSVRALAREVAEKYPGKYNIYQVCAIFDLISNSIAYTSEPEGEERWQFPNETLRIKRGDCEDHAFLLASLICALGGNARVYATDNHVFASVYIGQANDTSKIIEAINRYYATRLAVYYQTDKYGSWLVLEPSGGFYAGSLPVGGRPTLDEGWTLSNTTTLYAFDAVPD